MVNKMEAKIRKRGLVKMMVKGNGMNIIKSIGMPLFLIFIFLIGISNAQQVNTLNNIHPIPYNPFPSINYTTMTYSPLPLIRVLIYIVIGLLIAVLIIFLNLLHQIYKKGSIGE